LLSRLPNERLVNGAISQSEATEAIEIRMFQRDSARVTNPFPEKLTQVQGDPDEFISGVNITAYGSCEGLEIVVSCPSRSGMQIIDQSK
jgi:hypothetical protein